MYMLKEPSSDPLHHQVAEELRGGIRRGEYPPGSRLPSEQELAHRHGVARGTIRQALTALRNEGALASRRGARGVVLATPRTQSFSELLSFSAWARSLGEEPSARVIELVRREAVEREAIQLSVAPRATVYELLRVRLLSGVPVMVERTLFVDEVGRLLGSIQLERDSIYERLADHGVVFARARHTIGAVAADSVDARLLDVRRGTALLRQQRRSTSPAGDPLELADDRYRGDAVSFVVDNTAASTPLARTRREERADGDR
jgi:GntR family transcriptional regulator